MHQICLYLFSNYLQKLNAIEEIQRKMAEKIQNMSNNNKIDRRYEVAWIILCKYNHV